MGELAERLGNKEPGDLIKAEDWNALVAGIESIETRLSGELTTLRSDVETHVSEANGRLDTLESRADAAEADIADLRSSVETIDSQFRRVSLSAPSVTFVIGQLAQITAHVTSLRGEPLDLSDAASRPWIDFATVWGQLRPAAGFTSRGGANDRTLSVQVNQDGEARVLLRAEHTEGLTAEAEEEVAAVLETALPSNDNKTLGTTILESATPGEAKLRGAFSVVSTEYDRTDAVNVRNYVDTYYHLNPARAAGTLHPIFTHRWRDYRATVIALAKPDSDPRTPSGSLGAASIQITFRDWIPPWISLDYFDQLPTLVEDYAAGLGELIDTDEGASFGRVREWIDDRVQDKGALAKQRDYAAIAEAIGQAEPVDPVPYWRDLQQTVRNGMQLQQATGVAQLGAVGLQEESAGFAVVAEADRRADRKVTQVREQVTETVSQQIAEVESTVQNQVRQEQQAFRDDLLREDGVILGVQRSLAEVNGKISGVQQTLGQKADVSLLNRFIPT